MPILQKMYNNSNERLTMIDKKVDTFKPFTNTPR